MKVWTTKHNGLTYRFELLESTGEVCVFKGETEEPTYHLIRSRDGGWLCDCLSGYYRKYCWHEDEMPLVLSQPSITEPWADWAEEAAIMRRINNGAVKG